MIENCVDISPAQKGLFPQTMSVAPVLFVDKCRPNKLAAMDYHTKLSAQLQRLVRVAREMQLTCVRREFPRPDNNRLNRKISHTCCFMDLRALARRRESRRCCERSLVQVSTRFAEEFCVRHWLVTDL
jgi:hypothetical protein